MLFVRGENRANLYLTIRCGWFNEVLGNGEWETWG